MNIFNLKTLAIKGIKTVPFIETFDKRDVVINKPSLIYIYDEEGFLEMQEVQNTEQALAYLKSFDNIYDEGALKYLITEKISKINELRFIVRENELGYEKRIKNNKVKDNAIKLILEIQERLNISDQYLEIHLTNEEEPKVISFEIFEPFSSLSLLRKNQLSIKLLFNNNIVEKMDGNMYVPIVGKTRWNIFEGSSLTFVFIEKGSYPIIVSETFPGIGDEKTAIFTKLFKDTESDIAVDIIEDEEKNTTTIVLKKKVAEKLVGK